MELSLCGRIESQCVWILTQLEWGRGIIRMAGEPGDRWLRSKNGGVSRRYKAEAGGKSGHRCEARWPFADAERRLRNSQRNLRHGQRAW
jgi:hypothetical protein